MAHFAQLNSDNEVLQVVVVGNPDTADSDGVEQESIGIAFCQSLFGDDTIWVQTSYNQNMRGNYAEVGGTYDADADVFKPVKPFPSWIWNSTDLEWEAPIAVPEGYLNYGWNEAAYQADNTQGWEELYHYPVWVQNKIWVWNIDLQVFEAVQPYPSWTQNENGLWTAPVAYPDSGNWDWSEQNQQWEEYTE